MSPEEMREGVRAEGVGPDAVVKDVRTDFARIAKEHKQKGLREAQEGYQAAVERFNAKKSRIPTDVPAMQAIYARMVQAHPLTVQHRELSSFSRDELHQLLEQLDALGLIPEEES